MMASIMVIFACLGYGGWYAAGKPDLVAALVGEAPQETVAAPQVETTATEPDNLIIQATEQELADAAPAETSPVTETGEAAIQAVAETAIPATGRWRYRHNFGNTPDGGADPATMVTEPGTETERLAAAASGTQSATGLPATTEEAPGEDTLAAATAPSAGDVDAQTEDAAVAAADTDASAAAATAGDAASGKSRHHLLARRACRAPALPMRVSAFRNSRSLFGPPL